MVGLSRLSYLKYKKYRDDIFDDELIQKAIDRLQKCHHDMEMWIRENEPLDKCPECGYKDLEYRYDGIKCNRPRCDFFKKVEVPPPQKSGVHANRTLDGIIREIFGRRMGQQKQREKPSAKEISELPIDLEGFNTGEYTKNQIQYLTSRFETLMEENNVNNEVDKFYIKSMCRQEVQIDKLEKMRAVDPDSVSTSELKRQYDIYNKLAKKVKASKDERDDDDEQRFYDDMEDVLEDSDIQDILKEYDQQSKEREEYKKKSKKRREEAGNPY